MGAACDLRTLPWMTARLRVARAPERVRPQQRTDGARPPRRPLRLCMRVIARAGSTMSRLAVIAKNQGASANGAASSVAPTAKRLPERIRVDGRLVKDVVLDNRLPEDRIELFLLTIDCATARHACWTGCDVLAFSIGGIERRVSVEGRQSVLQAAVVAVAVDSTREHKRRRRQRRQQQQQQRQHTSTETSGGVFAQEPNAHGSKHLERFAVNFAATWSAAEHTTADLLDRGAGSWTRGGHIGLYRVMAPAHGQPCRPSWLDGMADSAARLLIYRRVGIAPMRQGDTQHGLFKPSAITAAVAAAHVPGTRMYNTPDGDGLFPYPIHRGFRTLVGRPDVYNGDGGERALLPDDGERDEFDRIIGSGLLVTGCPMGAEHARE